MTSKMTLLTKPSASKRTRADHLQLSSVGQRGYMTTAQPTGQLAQATETHTAASTLYLQTQSAHTLTDAQNENKALAEMLDTLTKRFRGQNLLTQRRMKSTDAHQPGALVFIISPALEALMRSVNNE